MNHEKREYLNGRVVLYRGDCLELLEAGLLECDAIVSDPPYGIGLQLGAGGNGAAKKHTRADPIIGDDRPFEPRPWLDHARKGTSQSMKPAANGKPVVLFGADHYKSKLPDSGGFYCWDKSCGHGPAASFVDAEYIWMNRKNPRRIFRHFWMGAMRAHDGFDGKKARQHLSQKPVNLMAWCMETARIGVDKVVLDPFMGSGSTGVAAIQTGRRFIGVEIDQEHFDTACKRIEKAIAELGLEAA